MKRFFLLGVLALYFISCKQVGKKTDRSLDDNKIPPLEEALYRPNFHFTPQAHWMNDPNGMFFLNGTYHLYFQYHPKSSVWGPMHWGHATSTNMITWKEQPIALYPDSLGTVFSGSAVVDFNDSSGFGTVNNSQPVVAIYTNSKRLENDQQLQAQSVAYSLDQGQTFTKYANNPVIENPGIKDFRDPKVTWDKIHKQWNLVLAAGDKVSFYSSKNLKQWNYLSDFGEHLGAHGGVWECPDFFPMQVEGTDLLKWVLLVSINPGGLNGGSATQYFIGDFDGETFTLDSSFKKDIERGNSIWIDYGKDNYAGVTWSNIPPTDGRTLFIGWMSNWQYAQQVPTETWRSAMTIPRELSLLKKDDSWQLRSLPVMELQSYVSKTIKQDRLPMTSYQELAKAPSVDLTQADIQFTASNLKEYVYSFVLSNSKGESVTFGLNNIDHYFFIDRSHSGKTSFSDDFANKPSKAPVHENLHSFKVRVVLDKTSIELFFNNGAKVMTDVFFNTQPFDTFSVKTKDTQAKINNLVIKQLAFEQVNH